VQIYFSFGIANAVQSSRAKKVQYIVLILYCC